MFRVCPRSVRFAPDLGEVREFLERMVKAPRAGELDPLEDERELRPLHRARAHATIRRELRMKAPALEALGPLAIPSRSQ